MRAVFLTLSTALLTCATLYADPPKSSDVPEAAKLEIERRGHMIEELGVIQAGPEAAIVQAMAPPEDDSDKWWATAVTAGETATVQEKAASKLLLDDVKGLKFKALVKPEDLKNSWAHWQERRFDDPLQQDWINPIRAQVLAVGLPCIVIQPPANGKYGPNSKVVCIVGKYDGGPENFMELILQRVRAYVERHSRDGSIAAGQVPVVVGHTQKGDPISGKPPFNLPEPVAYPDASLLPKKTMTFEQIRKKFPNIPASEAATYADQELTEEQIADAERHLEQPPTKTPEVDSTPANPQTREPTPSASAENPILTTAAILILVVLGYIGYRLKEQTKTTSKSIASTPNNTTGSSTANTLAPPGS